MKPSIPLAAFLTLLVGATPLVLMPFSGFSSGLAQAQTPPAPAPNFGANRPLSGVLENMEGLPLSAVRLAAAQQSDATLGPKYRNIPTQLPFYAAFEGDFVPAGDDTRLAIFSDDGCNVYLDGVRVLNNLDRGQHLPKLDESLKTIDEDLVAGQSYHVRIEYSNTVYGDSTDADGATLFAYSTGDNTPPKPDLSVRLIPEEGDEEPEWIGQDIFNQDSSDQTVTAVTMIGATQRFAVRVDNPTLGTRSFKIALPLAPAGWTVHLFDALEGGSEVTEAAQSDEGWVTPALDSGLWKDLRLEVTAESNAGESYEAKVRAGEDDLIDQISCISALQKIAKIQWSYDGKSWEDVTATTRLLVSPDETVGLKAIRSVADAEWPDQQPLGPKWKWKNNTLSGETVWLAGDEVTGTVDKFAIATLGTQSVSVTIQVVPACEVSISASKTSLLAGSGPSNLTSTGVSVRVHSDTDAPQNAIKVRLRALNAAGQPFGTWNDTTTSHLDVTTGADGTAYATWKSGNEAGEGRLEATVLGENDRPRDIQDVLDILTHKPYTQIKLGAWRQENGAWNRTVTVSTWFVGQKLGGVAVGLSAQVKDYDTEQIVAGWTQAAPFDAATGTTDVSGNFSTVQRWNPVEVGAWPHDYLVEAKAELQ